MSVRQIIFCVVALVCVFSAKPVLALAPFTQTFTPSDADLGDLPHQYAVRWGINYSIPTGYQLAGARIVFTNIRNWDTNPNVLYVSLLNLGPSHSMGLRWYEDNPNDNVNDGDYFAGKWSAYLLTDPAMPYGSTTATLRNLPMTAQTLTFHFDATELAVLASYMADGYFGLGFDPDCHFFNDKVRLKLDFVPTPPNGGNPPVPEPVTSALGLMSLASLGLALRRRRA